MIVRRIATLLILLAMQVLSSTQVANAEPAGAEHLPDLKTLKPSDFVLDTSGGTRMLRFSNTVANVGAGRLELRPANPAPTLLGFLFQTQGTTRAYQVIYTHDAAGTWRKVREQQVGTFQYHSTHNHWHFEKFARYELYNSAPDGTRGSTLHRVAEKTTFCIIDTDLVDSTLVHSGSRTYSQCGRDSTTGLTVGWGDKYAYNLDGQGLDVQNLPDGDYWLVSTADYGRKIIEINDENNTAEVKLRLTGSTVTVMS